MKGMVIVVKFFIDSLTKSALTTNVGVGQSISIKVDLILAHDGSWEKVYNCWEQNNLRMNEYNRFIVTVDHAYPAPTIVERIKQREMAEISKEKRFELYNHGEGVLHQVVAENVNIKPGMIIVGCDGHVATAGALGAISFSLSPDDLVKVLQTGVYNLTIPEVVTINLEGELKYDTMSRDVALYILGNHSDDIKNKAVALRGPFVENASIDSRMTICNLLPEAGVVTAFVVPNNSEIEGPVINIDVNKIESMVVVPPSPVIVKPIREIKDKEISVAIIGGCSYGRMEDMKAVAQVLNGKVIHKDVTLIITPASRKIANKMDRTGITEILRNSGAVIMPPGCGTCPGKHFWSVSSNRYSHNNYYS